MSAHHSPFTKRFRAKMDEIPALMRRLTLDDAGRIQRAFVAALKEEVADRYKTQAEMDKDEVTLLNYNLRKPLVIAGLGSFKMKTRPQRTFDSFRYAQAQSVFGNDGIRPRVTKPPARRLVFTSKWEALP